MPKGALTVTQFVALVNEVLGTLESVTVEGEVEEYKVISHKWVVFDLKDNESLVRCFMPIWQLRTAIEDGMLVRVTGQPKLRPKGFFSFVLDAVQPAGEGALRRAFELLKEKLTGEGLFAPERKRALPRFPARIALITSRDAAAYGDFIKILNARHGGLTIYFIHTAVQGEEAPFQLLSALERANTGAEGFDVIVMVRGGGSMEDLQAFNDEVVVRAVAGSRLPIVVGVGHERDVTLAELAADRRASTPSNAAELIIQSRSEISLALNHLQRQLQTSVNEQIAVQQTAITHALTVLRRRVATTRQQVGHTLAGLQGLQSRLLTTIQGRRQDIKSSRHSLHRQVGTALRERRQSVQQLIRHLQSLSPTAILKRGYSITHLRSEASTFAKATADKPVGKPAPILKNAKDAALGSILETQLSEGTVISTVGKPASPAGRLASRMGRPTKSQLELGL